MTWRFGKWLKYLQIAQIYVASLKYLRNGISMQMTEISALSLRYVLNGFSILETALICWKWRKNLRKGLYMWQMRHVCGKWLKYLRNG